MFQRYKIALSSLIIFFTSFCVSKTQHNNNGASDISKTKPPLKTNTDTLSPDLLFLLSEDISLYDDSDESLELYKKVFNTSPNYPTGIKIAKKLYMSKQYSECEQFSNKLKTVFPNEIEPYQILAKCQFALNKTMVSINTLNTALKKQPKDNETIHLLVSVYLKTNQTKKALETLNNFIKKYPDNYNLLLLKSKISYEQEHFLDALALSEDLINKWPDPADAYVIMGLSALKLKDNKKALFALQEAFNKHPENISIVPELLMLLDDSNKILEQIQVIKKLEARLDGELPRSFQFRLGQLLIQNNQFSLAYPIFLELSETEQDPEKNEDHHFLLGLCSESMNKPQEALNHYTFVKINSKKRKLVLKRIFGLSLKLKNWTQAENALREFNKHKIDGPADAFFYSSGLWELGKKEESIQETQLLVQKNKSDLPLRLLEINQTYFNNPYSQESLEALLKLTQEFPDDPDIMNHIGYTLLHSDVEDNLLKGKQFIEAAIKKNPENLYFQDSLGWACLLLKDFNQADSILSHIIIKIPEEAIFIFHLAELRFIQNKREESKDLYLKAKFLLDENQNNLRPKDWEDTQVYATIKKRLDTLGN